jgi:hypothetical protein
MSLAKELDQRQVDTLVKTAPPELIGRGGPAIVQPGIIGRPYSLGSIDEVGYFQLELWEQLKMAKLFGLVNVVELPVEESLALAIQSPKEVNDYWGGWYLGVIRNFRDFVAVETFGRDKVRRAKMFGHEPVDRFRDLSDKWIKKVNEQAANNQLWELGVVVGSQGRFSILTISLPCTEGESFSRRLSPKMFFVGREEELGMVSKHSLEKTLSRVGRRENNTAWWEEVAENNRIFRGDTHNEKVVGSRFDFGKRATTALKERCSGREFYEAIRGADLITGYSVTSVFPPYFNGAVSLTAYTDDVNWVQKHQGERSRKSEKNSIDTMRYYPSWSIEGGHLDFSDAPSWGNEWTVGVDIEFVEPDGIYEEDWVITNLEVSRRLDTSLSSWNKTVVFEEDGCWVKWFNPRTCVVKKRPVNMDDLQKAKRSLESAGYSGDVSLFRHGLEIRKEHEDLVRMMNQKALDLVDLNIERLS